MTYFLRLDYTHKQLLTHKTVKVDHLHNIIQHETLKNSIELGGLAYEKDFYGQKMDLNGNISWCL
jgi:hypothetical protein